MTPEQARKKLHIPDATLEYLLNLLKADKQSLGLYSEESHMELIENLSEMTKEEAKELVIKELALCQNYILKHSKHADGNKIEEYNEAYQVILQKDKSQEQEENHSENFQTTEIIKKSTEQQEMDSNPLQFSDSVLAFIGDVNYTKGRMSAGQLERNKKSRNAANKPAYPYRWAVKVNTNLANFCLLDDENDLGERVVVTRLGEYYYETDNSFVYNSDIVGITRLDANGNELSSDVMIAQLDFDANGENRDFAKNVYFSKENIERAKNENNSYIGRIAHRKFSAQELNLSQEEINARLANGLSITDIDVPYITYNGPGTSELVTSLEVAKFMPGNCSKNRNVRKIINFELYKKGLHQLQKEYIKEANTIRKPAPEEPDEREII